MTDQQFVDLENALNLLNTTFGVMAVVTGINHKHEINQAIFDRYGEVMQKDGVTLLSGVQIFNL